MKRRWTRATIGYVIEVVEPVYNPREDLGGFRVIRQATVLRHLTIEYEPA